MRQSLLVIAFVAYSLFAFGQAPMPEPKGPYGGILITDKMVEDWINGLMKKYNVDINNRPIPSFNDFQSTYKVSLDPKTRDKWEAYRKNHNSHVVGTTITTLRYEGYASRSEGFMGLGFGGMPVDDCAVEEAARCDMKPNRKVTLEVLRKQQADCLEGVAAEIQKKPDSVGMIRKSNAQCANELRTLVRNYRRLNEELAKPVVKTAPTGRASGAGPKDAPKPSRGRS